jgi:rhodanese-related sulfurtransferase
MRTPLGRVRCLGPARSGTSHFWLQRLTAMAQIPLAIYFVFLVASLAGSSHATVATTLGRPQAQRRREGEVPGALVIERNVLEWRFDPACPHRVPQATDHDLQVIVFCSEGYTSSLAAADLQELGLARATDLAGGYWAWVRAGLPTIPGGRDPDA